MLIGNKIVCVISESRNSDTELKKDSYLTMVESGGCMLKIQMLVPYVFVTSLYNFKMF